MNPKLYYGSHGAYLKEHATYFTQQRLIEETDFIISALKLSKNDKVLDLACGNGRHTIALKMRGYDIVGADFSSHLLNVGKKIAKSKNLQIKFFRKSVHDLNFESGFDKIFLFFSEFGLFDAKKVLKNVNKSLKENGLFLLDCDNIFRLAQYLMEHPRVPFTFDCINSVLKAKGSRSKGVRYYNFPEMKALFQQTGFEIVSVYGSYRKERLNIKSKRMIIIAKKTRHS